MAFTGLRISSKPESAYTVVAACGMILSADEPGKYIAVKNPRGWDVPGGRLEEGETPEQAFRRELMEESGHELIEPPEFFTMLEMQDNPQLGVTIFKGTAKRVGALTATGEIEATALLTPEELTERYFGDKELMSQIIARQ